MARFRSLRVISFWVSCSLTRIEIARSFCNCFRKLIAYSLDFFFVCSLSNNNLRMHEHPSFAFFALLNGSSIQDSRLRR